MERLEGLFALAVALVAVSGIGHLKTDGFGLSMSPVAFPLDWKRKANRLLQNNPLKRS